MAVFAHLGDRAVPASRRLGEPRSRAGTPPRCAHPRRCLGLGAARMLAPRRCAHRSRLRPSRWQRAQKPSEGAPHADPDHLQRDRRRARARPWPARSLARGRTGSGRAAGRAEILHLAGPDRDASARHSHGRAGDRFGRGDPDRSAHPVSGRCAHARDGRARPCSAEPAKRDGPPQLVDPRRMRSDRVQLDQCHGAGRTPTAPTQCSDLRGVGWVLDAAGGPEDRRNAWHAHRDPACGVGRGGNGLGGDGLPPARPGTQPGHARTARLAGRDMEACSITTPR
jgi:hypothetical protein